MVRPLYCWYFLFACTAGAAVLGNRVLSPAPSAHVESEMLSSPTFDGQRLAAKSRIAEEAAAGRLSLLQAAAALKELDDAGAPYSLHSLTIDEPNESLDEVYCQMVIHFLPPAVSADTADNPAHRLQMELAQRLRDGSLRLPEKARYN
jgi:hypothetical protein